MNSRGVINIRCQNGFLLPLMVLMLVTVGSGAVVSLSISSQQSSGHIDAPRYLIAEQQLKQLNMAKQALIAYAVSYADNYGPGGAGPGHFPCPDLDAPDDGNAHNDGPDPPCGASAQQIGRVPRITLASRTSFPELITHIESKSVQGDNRHKLLEFYPQASFIDRQPWYWIDGDFVNNPLNRIVNSDVRTSLRTRQGRDVIALLLTPGQELEILAQQRPGLQAADYVESVLTARVDGVLSRDHLADSNDNTLFIYRDEVMPLVERRVAGFVAERLREYRQRQCPLIESISANCYPFATVSVAGEANCLPTPAVSVTVMDSDILADEHPANERLRYALCSSWMLHDAEFQGVSQRRHWYFRNRWDQYIGFSVEPVCLEQMDAGCVITVGKGTSDVQKEIEITIARPLPPSLTQSLLQAGNELHG